MNKYIEHIRVENFVNDNGNKVPNQFKVTTPNGTYFQSYDSIIIFEDKNGKITLGRDWDYSQTTGKYRNQYLGEGIAETRKKIEDGTYTVDNTL
jgi:hypothetical protein